MKKLNKNQVERIKQLYKEGKTLTEIAKMFKVTKSAIHYHLNPEEKLKRSERRRNAYQRLTREEKKEIFEKQREYQREYHRRRYNKDRKFKKKQCAMSRLSNKKRYERRIKNEERKRKN